MPTRRTASILLGLAGAVCLSQGVTADQTPTAGAATAPGLQLPAFRPGLWEYRRTQITSSGGKPHTTTLRRCLDPGAEFSRKLVELQQRGCVFKPMKQNGRQYVASWRCTAPDGAVLAMRDIITVNSDTSYLNESEAVIAHEATHSTIVALRVGDCPTARSSRPAR